MKRFARRHWRWMFRALALGFVLAVVAMRLME